MLGLASGPRSRLDEADLGRLHRVEEESHGRRGSHDTAAWSILHSGALRHWACSHTHVCPALKWTGCGQPEHLTARQHQDWGPLVCILMMEALHRGEGVHFFQAQTLIRGGVVPSIGAPVSNYCSGRIKSEHHSTVGLALIKQHPKVWPPAPRLTLLALLPISL